VPSQMPHVSAQCIATCLGLPFQLSLAPGPSLGVLESVDELLFGQYQCKRASGTTTI
jgi:hypothetical protein